jgi:hypothetical protein
MISKPTSRTEAFTVKTTKDVINWIGDVAEAMQISRNELLNRILQECMNGTKDHL